MSSSNTFKNAKERTLKSIVAVELDDLLIVVGTLEQLDSGIEGTSLSIQHNLNTVDKDVEWVSSKGPSLQGHGSFTEISDGFFNIIGSDVSSQWEFHVSNIPDCKGFPLCGRSLDDDVEGSGAPIFRKHAHLNRGVIWSLPELDTSIERTACSSQNNLHTINRHRGKGPSLQGVSSLHKFEIIRVWAPGIPSDVAGWDNSANHTFLIGDLLPVIPIGWSNLA
jgi:hypothetical protein